MGVLRAIDKEKIKFKVGTKTKYETVNISETNNIELPRYEDRVYLYTNIKKHIIYISDYSDELKRDIREVFRRIGDELD